jgi:type II secretory pathway predicted ATPase ExeA
LLLNHFNLRDQPFGVTPDPRYLFLTRTHREALEGLLYGIDSGLGFIALTGEPGMGKTTLLRLALNRLGNTARTVSLFQAITNPTELFRALLIDLGEKDPPGTLIDLEMRLNEILMRHNESGQRVVVFLDEAQNLGDSVLEAIRMLSNFETSRHKLLQVIICGQQQLADRLATPELVQLRQRISIFATLRPLTRLEAAEYIEHRLKVAGYENSTPLFTPEAVSLIAHYSDGIPRNINNICFNSLSIGYTLGKKAIDAEVVRAAIVDLRLEGSKLAEPTDDLGWQGETFVEPIVAPGFQGATFAESAEPTDDLGRYEARFSESTDEPGLPEAKFAEAPDDPGLHEAKFAEAPDDLSWQRARFVESARYSEPDEYESEELDPSEQRETSPGRRVALIAALIFAMAFTGTGLYLARSGGSPSLLMSQVTSQVNSWLHSSPQPVNNQPQVQPPATPETPESPQPQASAPPQFDQSAQSSMRQQDQSAPQAATPSQNDSPSYADSSLPSAVRPAVPSDTKPAKDATAPPPSPFLGVSRPNHDRFAAKLPSSRVPIPNGGVEVVRASQGQSVAGICVRRFNGCTPALLNTIAELNPGIKDQDHLEAGQQVFLPAIESRPQQRN